MCTVKSYKTTKIGCYLGFFTQAIVINLAPLMFASFQERLSLSYEQLGRLILINFCVQICVDVLFIKLVNILPLRFQLIASQSFSIVGLWGLSLFPEIMPDYAALILAVVIYSIGGGLIEVVLNPGVSEMPGVNAKVEIPLLHSFYCWGHVLVCLLSTLALHFFSQSGYILPFVWSAVPLCALVIFIKAPIPTLTPAEKALPIGRLLCAKTFIAAMAVMVCSGAVEQTMAQWVSFFAEKGLCVPKIAGDIFGLCSFALCMALCRTLYGIFGERLDLKRVLFFSSLLGIVSYSLICFVNDPYVSLVACGLCGISVSLMWPGTVAYTGQEHPTGSAGMFALLSVMGDVGCSLGPWITGAVSDIASDKADILSSIAIFKGMGTDQIALKCGMSCMLVLLVVMAVILFPKGKKKGKKN